MWRLNINETKSTQVTFTLRREQCPAVHINNTVIPQSSTAKCLGLHFIPANLEAAYNKKKKNWIIGRKSTISLDSKVLLYKTIIKPIWTYGIELLGCASNSHIDIMQRSHSKRLLMITNAHWYVSTQTIHVDLHVPFIKDVIQETSKKHHDKLGNISNAILQPLLAEHQRRRLKNFWLADLIDDWRGSLIAGALITIP
jgi:hypothetical protein